MQSPQTIIFILLIFTYWCSKGHGDNIEMRREIRQERAFNPSHSTGQLHRIPSSSTLRSSDASQQAAAFESVQDACNDDIACLTLASQDRLGLDAIRSLHRQLDDDANGAVDLSESDEFLREELKYEEGYERRQRAFHYNDDMHISVRELWDAWIRSEVHNWTVEQTSEWLASNVELPQYIPVFIQHRVTGATLPRLAVPNMHYFNVLGIKDPIHKQKIALKAMDVVLFGPPKDYNHHIKDVVLVTSLLGALIGCWYAYRQNKNSRRHLHRMMKDMEGLHKAELALDHLQKELERAKLEQESVTTEKQNLERQLLKQGGEQSELRTSYSDLEVSQLKAEIELLRGELQRAEGELEDRCWSPPVGLQQWLQLTHEIENKSYIKKKNAAEVQLTQLREACEKLRKKRSSPFGAFVSTHSRSMDDVDRCIMEAKISLKEVTHELKERVHRWKQIELLLGFNIINNNGLPYLESILYRGTSNGRASAAASIRGRMSSSQDDIDDDACSIYATAASGGFDVHQWKDATHGSTATLGLSGVGGGADSSSSERDDESQTTDARGVNSGNAAVAAAGSVHFTLGGEGVSKWVDECSATSPSPGASASSSLVKSHGSSSALQQQAPPPPPRVSSMSRTQSHEAVTSLIEKESSANLPDTPPIVVGRKSSRDRLDELETCSTDSNSQAESEDAALRRKKRKLFPTFPRTKPKGHNANAKQQTSS